MAQILDKQGLQHYANKMCNADNRKVGSKSLPTALNDIDTAIDGFKTLFESEYGSALDMKLENNENAFSVGTGTNVDKRSEVENSFTDVELSGNSLVNCVLIDKLYEDSNYLECENSPVVTEGNITLKSRQLNHVRFCPKIECGVIKPNTKYTLIFNVTSNNLTGRTNLTHTNTDTLISAFPFVNTIQPKQTGIFKYVLTSTADISSCNILLRTIIWNDCSTEGETITFSLMILEGDWTNKPIPQYFEGLKSIGEKEDGNHKISISSVEKNLLDPSTIAPHPNYSSSFYQATFDGEYIIFDNKGDTSKGVMLFFNKPIYLEKGCSYKTIIESDSIPLSSFHNNLMFSVARNNGSVYCTINNKGTITTLNNIESGWYWCRTEIPKGGNSGKAKITLTKETTLQKHEPYKEDKKEILLNEPLRGLPNGIRDTIEKINGEWKIVRRCVEVTLNGSETSWSRNTDLNGTEVLFFYINTKSNTSLPEGAVKTDGSVVNVQCDSFPCYTLNNRVNNKNNNIEGIIYSDSANPLIQFYINKSKLTSEDVTGFEQWISQNPTKVIYELATPIIEDISPVTLQCWKNGTIFIDEVLPVESTHTVSLNKGAQIQRNIEELTELRNRVKNLEETYEQLILDQTYQLALLNNSIKLDNK